MEPISDNFRPDTIEIDCINGLEYDKVIFRKNVKDSLEKYITDFQYTYYKIDYISSIEKVNTKNGIMFRIHYTYRGKTTHINLIATEVHIRAINSSETLYDYINNFVTINTREDKLKKIL